MERNESGPASENVADGHGQPQRRLRRGRELGLAGLLVVGATGCSYSINSRQRLTAAPSRVPVAAMILGLLLLLAAGSAVIFACCDRFTTYLHDHSILPRSTPVSGVVPAISPASAAVLAMIFWMIAGSLVTVGQVARSANARLPRTSVSLVQVSLKTRILCTDVFLDSGICSDPAPHPFDTAETHLDGGAAVFAFLAVACMALCLLLRARMAGAVAATVTSMLLLLPIGLVVGLYYNYVVYPRFDARLVGAQKLPGVVLALTLYFMVATLVSAQAAVPRPLRYPPPYPQQRLPD